VFDIETRRHPQLRASLGIDEKVARLDDLEVDDLKLVADREEFKLGNRKTREAVYSKIVDDFDRLVSKAAVKLFGCEIYAIGCAFTYKDAAVQALAVGETDDGDRDEKAVIQAFMALLEREAPVCMMGFNIRGFDLPVLRTRCIQLDIHWPEWLPQTRREDKYERDYVFDIQDVFDEGNLDTWLRMSGLPPKTAKGSDTQNMTAREVAQYVAADVERERMLVMKILPHVWHYRELLEREAIA
jgi:hypothetical protein